MSWPMYEESVRDELRNHEPSKTDEASEKETVNDVEDMPGL